MTVHTVFPTKGSSTRKWPGMRSEYGWATPSGEVTVTGPQQVGVSFAVHERVVTECDACTDVIAIRPGDGFTNGRATVAWSEVTAPDEWLEIYPDPSLLREVAGTPTTPEIELSYATRDAVVLGTASVLKKAHVQDAPLDEMQASSLAHGLARHLVHRYCGLRVGRDDGPPRLDADTLDRVAELVEARLAEPLSLTDLAAEAALSPFHFARGFKTATGLAPHQFVTARRMDRAKSLLLSSRLPVSEVAFAVGYSNVSHFRRVFRRHNGCRPGEFRR